MSRKLLIATKNEGKMKEFRAFFSNYGWDVLSLNDIDQDIDVIEDGETFEANAEKKAEETGKQLQMPVLADDSGLEVDALDGAPGIYSARYAGEEKNDEANNRRLLNELEGVENRTARFVCVLAVYSPEKGTHSLRGTCSGKIGTSLHGDGGFGYDPLFYLPEKEKYMAELTREEKNQLSHRADALHRLESVIEEWLGTEKGGSV
ncbi:XTP/dITP diphosphatase [Alkalicoccus urumqiensis]|uniref:dITP/XTP pyrophosphatase n=1 Tax=Alkalicoccus urumqiensis TaxID=1548213 RepID=A0A2P6MFA4_ALKUR|nr:XTP/dITP diphosphatase [Alkalicoccus urumqiensis]PRO64930.1 non-canonical purine NTP pyrophosphatase [Alkalicoccus urumqiensis]